ncbi:MAG: leishmanolysin-related zinc metalloendopeptidase, partial [Planctomycetaceae bacterium]
MFLSCWLTSVRNLFASRRGRGFRRPGARRGQRGAAGHHAQRSVEQLEARQVLAFDFVSAYPNSGAFLTEGAIVDQAPQQITIKFSPGSKVDPQSIATGISVIRSGNGVLGDSGDIVVTPGSITVDDFPNQNVVIVRFAETLPDDRYRLLITGAGPGGLRTLSQGAGIPSERFRAGGSYQLDFRLDLGAQVASVVPQPVARPKLMTFATDMAQYKDGDLLSVAIRGGRLTFEFDGNSSVAAGNRAVSIVGRTAAEITAEIALAITSSGVFGGELLSATTPQTTRINLRGTTFTPVVSFTRAGSVPAVVPVTIADGAALTQARDTVAVYFNANDPLDPASARNPRNYRLVETDPVTKADIAVKVPQAVSYDAASGTALLTFEAGGIADDRLYRLRIGDSSDDNNLLAKATPLGALFTGNPYRTDAVIGDGAEGMNDVDLYQASLTAAGSISATLSTPVGSALVGVLRLFDSAGVEVASSTTGSLVHAVAAPGIFYLGVSSTGNGAYQPATGTGATGGSTSGAYRIRITSSVAVGASDDNSSFASATGLGTLGVAGQTVSGRIDVRPTIATPAGPLLFPSQPGTIDEPGHRDIPVDGESHIDATSSVGPASDIPVVPYNFRIDYGVDPQGNPLFNAITEEQKQRAREVFTLLSINAGIRFVETAADGLFVATGDLRALSPNIPPNAAAGLGGPGGVVMNSTIDWGNSEYGGAWFTVAMHEIGHAIGLGHAYDIPAVMGAGETGDQQLGENLLPLPYDVVHMNVLYPRNGSDIDVYSFALDTAGTFSAETIVARQGQAAASALDTVLSLYREVGGVRTLVARNDDYYGTDSFVGLELEAGSYFLAVSSTGNTAFNPEVSDSGYGGRTDGAYELRLDFKPAAAVAGTLVDATGTPFDGDRDGETGGAFDSWFTTASATATLWVDKVAAAAGSVTASQTLVTGISTVGLVVGRAVIGAGIQPNTVVQSIRDANSFFLSRPATITSAAAALGMGTFAAPYRTISAAISAANAALAAGSNVPRIIRILGNSGNDATTLDEKPYLVGTTLGGTALADGATFNVPKGMTAMIDATAAIKLRAAVIDVGSSSGLVSRAGAAIQVLGTPGRQVIFTSFHDDTVGGDSDGVGPAVQGGQWGGIVLRQDSDSPRGAATTVPHDPWVNKPWLNTIAFASLRYGGGNVMVDSSLQSFAPIHLESTRPTIAFNDILSAAGPGISADPNSFEDSGGRFGPELRGNRLLDNTINGLFIRIRTEFGAAIDKLDRPARFKSTDITYVIQENLVIAGGAGGYLLDETSGDLVARATGRLVIDPGVVVKLMGARIELERGNAQLVAEGTPLERVIFTSLADNRYGAGGTFDTNGNAPDVRGPGDWSGIVAQAGAEVSIDNAYIAYGGGQSAIEGGFDRFDTIEVQQAILRLANSRVEFNASGRSTTQRNARGSNDDSTVFVRQAQPVIVGNDFRDNSGATFSLNANSFSNTANPDPGRSTGAIGRSAEYDDNVGPLLRANAISNKINYASDRQKGSFDITLEFAAGVTKAVRDAMEVAADRWETVITGDISAVLSGGRVIDDILVRVQAGLLGGSPSDGAGGTLANAGPTAFRSDTDVNPFLPYEARVGVDMADATSGQLVAILTHELGHALGFLDVSDALGLTSGARYVGAAALAEYRSVFDARATFVPLETGGGPGTAFAHWEETTFGSELLTGFLNPGINPLTRLSINAFRDMGYSVNVSAADDYLPRSGTVGYAQPTSGVVVRGEQILVDSVWDDTDLVHVVASEITVDNFHTATGLRLESQSNASLVVKLAGPSAGFTATGTPGSIDDRIGGTVQVIGQPGYPVVLTSLFDDSVGASLDPLGRTVFDTNNDGRAWIDSTATAPITASWRSLKFLPLANDTNVAFVREAELPYTNKVDVNQTPFDAQMVGILAPNFAVGGASTESAQHKGTDENRRDGFVVRGAIAVDNPGDVDVYSFGGYAGSEVWLDIDQTSSSLDTMLELLDAGGTVLARSVDGQFDSLAVTGETATGAGAAATQTYALSSGRILPGSLGGSIYHGNTVVQTFTVDRAGAFTFSSVGAPARRVTSATLDRDTGVVTLVWNGAVAAGGTRIVADYAAARLSLSTLCFTATGANGALPLGKDAWRGNDYGTVNPRDAGMRVILPGTQGSLNLYFLRVRSQPKVPAGTTAAGYEAALVDPTTLGAGATSGAYQLRVRLQQRDHVPGSAVVYADIRYATTGIDVQGLPRNSLLTGTAAQAAGGSNRELISAQDIGKLLASDQNTISVAGRVDSPSDVRWFKFTADYANDIQAIAGVNGGGKTWATVLDIDYASGFRGDLSLAVFDEDGKLIFLGRDSDVAADQPAPGQGNDFDDLSRGSAGKLDPFIGTVQLPVGATTDNPTEYYVAIMSNATLPEVLDGTFRSGSTNAQVRLEPVNSVARIVEDHLGFTGYASNGAMVAPKSGALFNVVAPDSGPSIALSANVRPFNLGDVTLYVSTGDRIFAADALRGQPRYDLGGYDAGVGDIDMRTDGKLFQVTGRRDDGNVGFLREISTADGAVVSEVGDAVPNVPDNPADTDFWKLTSDTVDALAIGRTDVAEYKDSVFYSLRRGTTSRLYYGRTDGNAAFADSEPFSLRGTITGAGVTGLTTGLQFRGENFGTLYGVSSGGQFYTVNPGSGAATLVADFSAELAAAGGGTGFQGLATAPVNLDGGRYQGMFFAITNTGRLVCIAPSITGTSATLLQNVFDNDADGVPEATISNSVGGG